MVAYERDASLRSPPFGIRSTGFETRIRTSAINVISHRVKRVYLDQNHWIYLSQALSGHPRSAEEADAALLIQASVETGLASYPLALGHLEETWRQRKAAKRVPLASAMSAISRHHTVAPPYALLPGELDRALKLRFDQPVEPRPVRPFGVGLQHMTAGGAPELDPDLVALLLERHPEMDRRQISDWVDALLLGGPDVDLPFEGIGPPSRTTAENFAAEENAQLERFADHDASSEMRRRGVAARIFMDMRDALQEAQLRTTISTDDILDLGAEGLTDLMRDLPSRDALLELATVQHRNPQTRWQPNDLNDLVYLGCAVGYCDIVVTERRWAANLNASDVPARRGTTVLARLADLPDALL